MPVKKAPEHKLEECQSHKGAGLKSGLTFGGKIPDSLKAGAHCERAPFFEKTLCRSNYGDFPAYRNAG